MVKFVVVVVLWENFFFSGFFGLLGSQILKPPVSESETTVTHAKRPCYVRPTHDLSSPADAKQLCFLYCLLMSTAAGWCIWNRPSPSSWTQSNWITMPHWASTHQGSRSIPSFNGLNWPTCGTHRLYTRDFQVLGPPASQHHLLLPPASQHHLHL